MTTFWHRLALPLKLAMLATLLCLFSSLTVVAVLQGSQERMVSDRLDALGTALVSRLAASAATPLVENDAIELQALVSGFAGENGVQRAALHDNADHIVAQQGDRDESGRAYTRAIEWQGSTVGRARLTLHPLAAGSELAHGLDLVMVAWVASLLGGALAWWLGQRFEALLAQLARRLGGEELAIPYQGADALGEVLKMAAVPMLTSAEPTAPASEALAQLYCPAETGDTAERSLALAEAVAQLYDGRAEVNRAGGVLMRFPMAGAGQASGDNENCFQAVCAALLLAELTRPQDTRLALTRLDGSERESEWHRQQCIESAYAAARSSALPGVVIARSLLAEPAIEARGRWRAVDSDGAWYRLEYLYSPYDALLRRQQSTLQHQLA